MTDFVLQLEVFQPFFIFLNLPYSVIRGEQFILEVNIFNYLKEEAEVKPISLSLNVTRYCRVFIPGEDHVFLCENWSIFFSGQTYFSTHKTGGSL